MELLFFVFILKNRDEALNNIISNDIIFTNAMHMMSNQVMSNNIGMTQFRSTAITNFSNSRGINIPQNMQQSFIERKADFNNLLDIGCFFYFLKLKM